MNRLTTTSLAFGIAAGCLVSCGGVKTTMNKVSTPMKNLTQLNKNDWKMFKLRDLRTDAPPVVKVRPGDLKKMKTGEEKIVAWNRSKRAAKSLARSSGDVFLMPEDFDPASLSDENSEVSYGILPPLNSDQVPTAQIPEDLGLLPTAAPPQAPTEASEPNKDL